MPPFIASLFFSSVIGYLFWIDRSGFEGNSKAIMVPFIWITFPHYFTILAWMGIRVSSAGGPVDEGNPINRSIYVILMLSGIYILNNRQVLWNRFFSKNVFIWLFFLYGLISILWSDFPFIAFKRWIKVIGVLVMVLIILTEKRPYESLGVIIKYASYVFLPLSILFIKYYPHLGRAYHMGLPMYTGVFDQKNTLGQICILSVLYFAWRFLYFEKSSKYQLHNTIYLIMFLFSTFLFYKANSATAMVCSIFAVFILIIARHPVFKNNYRIIIPLATVSVLIYIFLDYAFNVKDYIIQLLGRRSDLTTRVPMWRDLLSMAKRPLIGTGFESFWLGDRLRYMISAWGISHQAHNGYIEMYLNLGWIGVSFLISWILSGIRNIQKYMALDYPAAIFRMTLMIVILLVNYTEATFWGTNTLWLIFFVSIFCNPKELLLHEDVESKGAEETEAPHNLPNRI